METSDESDHFTVAPKYFGNYERTAKHVLLWSLEMFLDDPRLELAHLEHALKGEIFFHIKKKARKSYEVVVL